MANLSFYAVAGGGGLMHEMWKGGLPKNNDVGDRKMVGAHGAGA